MQVHKLICMSAMLSVYYLTTSNHEFQRDKNITAFLQSYGVIDRSEDENVCMQRFQQWGSKSSFDYKGLYKYVQRVDDGITSKDHLVRAACTQWWADTVPSDRLKKIIAVLHTADFYGVDTLIPICLDELSATYNIGVNNVTDIQACIDIQQRLSPSLQAEIAKRILAPHYKNIIAKNSTIYEGDCACEYYHPQGKQILKLGFFDTTVCSPDGRILYHLPQDYACTTKASYSQQGDYFALADSTITIWASKDGQLVQTVPSEAYGDFIESPADILKLLFNADDSLLAVHDEAHHLIIWRWQEGLKHQQLDSIDDVAMSYHGGHYATIDRKNNITLWHAQDASVQYYITSGDASGSSCEKSLVYTRDDQKLISYLKGSSAINIWDVGSGSLLHHLVPSGPVYALALTPDESSLVAAVGNQQTGGLFVWDMHNGTLRYHQKDEFFYGASVDIMHDGSLIVCANRYPTNNQAAKAVLKIWDLVKGKMLHELPSISCYQRIAIPSYDALMSQANVTITDGLKSILFFKLQEERGNCARSPSPPKSPVLRRCFK